MAEQILQIQHLSKSFGANLVLKDVDFQVNVGDVTCIIGASGSGKSTLLRCINLLETPSGGRSSSMGRASLPASWTPPPTGPRWAWCSSP